MALSNFWNLINKVKKVVQAAAAAANTANNQNALAKQVTADYDKIAKAAKDADDKFISNNTSVSTPTALERAAAYELMVNVPNDTRQITKINRFKLQVPESRLSTKGFLFMTRPNMNLFKTTTNSLSSYKANMDKINDDLGRLPTFNYIFNLGKNEFSSGEALGKRIFKSLAAFVDPNFETPWLAIMTNQFTGYAPAQREIDYTEMAKTFHGNSVLYGEPTFKHKVAGTVSMEFTDRRDLSLFYTIKLWAEYIQAVTLGYASPYRRYIGLGILDYAASAYYVVTDETMENIIYWEKLTGIFPLSVPDDIFATQDGINDKDLKYNINFAYSMRSVQHEAHLMEMNALYKIRSDYIRMDINKNKIAVDNLNSSTSPHSSLESFATSVTDTLKSKNMTADQRLIDTIMSYYGTKNINCGNAMRYYYIDGTGEAAAFYPNYLPELGIHGVPYVNGPYITMGDSMAMTGSDSSSKNRAAKNDGQYKLRWV